MSKSWVGLGGRPGATAAAFLADVVEYAISELLGNGDDMRGVLPEVLARLGAPMDCRCVLALRQEVGQPLTVIAAHPAEVVADAALLTELNELTVAHRGAARAGSSFSEPLRWAQPLPGEPDGDVQLSVLMAYSAPADDHRLCTIALVSEEGAWTPDAHPASRVIAGIVAEQIRRTYDRARLLERQALTSALFEGSPDPVIVCGPDRRIVAFNPAAEALFGYQRSEMIGQDIADALLPEHKQAEFRAGTQSYRETGDRGMFAGRMRYPVLLADGTQRTVELAPTLIVVDGVEHFCAFMRDVSELELAHAARAENEQRFRALAQATPAGILQLDGNGLCTFADQRWCELTGMTARDATGAGWASALHPDDAVRIEREWAVAAARGTELSTAYRLVDAGGSEIWVEATAIPVLDPDGQPAGFVSAVTDVTARKNAEAEREILLGAERTARRDLADQTGRLRSLISKAIPGIVMCDQDGRVAQLNQSWCDLFGVPIPAGQLAGVSATALLDLVKPVFADPGAFERRFAELSAGRQPVKGQQFACRDGRTIEMDYWPVLVDEDYRGDFWIFRDSSDRSAAAGNQPYL
jgi:PAS domain S-box-containing protein